MWMLQSWPFGAFKEWLKAKLLEGLPPFRRLGQRLQQLLRRGSQHAPGVWQQGQFDWGYFLPRCKHAARMFQWYS